MSYRIVKNAFRSNLWDVYVNHLFQKSFETKEEAQRYIANLSL
jgi:hypothetical protein